MLKIRLFPLFSVIFVIALAAILIVFVHVSSHPVFTNQKFREFNFDYTASVHNIPNDANNVEIWMPVPQTTDQQQISDITVNCAFPYYFISESKFGNRMLYIKAKHKHTDSMEVNVRFRVKRKAVHAQQQPQIYAVRSREDLRKFLQPDSLIPRSRQIAQEAAQVISPSMSEFQKVRAIYDHLVQTMKYDQSGKGWGRGDALYAFKTRRGNCTDFHSLFIAMVRSCGIPARFVSGLPLTEKNKEGDISGYLCWAEFYLDGKGWIPVDVSEANRHPERQKFYFGNLDANRFQFTVGRDIPLEPMHIPVRMNYFIYPYIMVDGKPYNEFSASMHFANVEQAE